MSTIRSELDPITPEDAQELYLKHKATECTEKTVQAHRYRTNHFVRWCGDKDITNLNELTGRHLQEYRLWRKEDGDLNQLTLNQQMSTIRVFLKWCGSIEAVPPKLYDKILIPRVGPDQQRRDEILHHDEAATILEYLSTFHYASTEHALIELLWETGIRLGSAHALDVSDINLQDNCLQIAHRPNSGTGLKNGSEGERPVAISPELAQVLADYISNSRHDVKDEHDREPLFTTTKGRMHRGTIRLAVYRITAPCFRNEPCEGCTGTNDKKCPEAVSPHAIRRGSITHFLANDVPVEIVGDRMNVSRKVLKKHYDRRTEEVKLEQRRGYLDNI